MGVEYTSSVEPDKGGIVASRDELIGLARLIASAQGPNERRVEAPRVGSNRSRLHGPGMEFSEVRAYQPGDDIRAIDWRVTARTGRAHSKLFEAEKERPAWFVVDLGRSMQFATRGALKSVAAARAASLLAWRAHLEGEPIGGIVRSPGTSFEILSGRTRRHLMRLLDALASATDVPLGASEEPLLIDELDWARVRARTGSRVAVVSDFYGLEADSGNETLAVIRSMALRCELTLVQIYDVLEAEAPPPGRYRVSDGQHTEALVAKRSRAWREGYEQGFRERRRKLRELAHSCRARLIPLRTDEPALRVLERGRAAARAVVKR